MKSSFRRPRRRSRELILLCFLLVACYYVVESFSLGVVNLRRCHRWSRHRHTTPTPTPTTTTTTFSAAANDDRNDNNAQVAPILAKGITIKVAVDRNGAAADLAVDEFDRFTGPESLDLVHRLRRTPHGAVLVGRATVVADNPSLTVRRCGLHEEYPQQPLRIVLDPNLELLLNIDGPKEYVLFHDGLPTVVYHGVKDLEESQIKALSLDSAVTLAFIPPEHSESSSSSSKRFLSPTAVWADLQHRFGIDHLMVEGGPRTAQQFLPLAHRVILVTALTVGFDQEPLPAGLEAKVLKNAGLELVGEYEYENNGKGNDRIECWTRPGTPWPTEHIADWP